MYQPYKIKSLQNIDSKTYTVRRRMGSSPPELTASASILNDAEELTDFVYPWETGKPVASMKFKAMYDDQWLYWLFQVEDEDIKIHVDKNEKEEVVYSDRVELFFTTDEALSSYYCLEIDPLARVFDYRGSHYRKFNTSWNWPEGHLNVYAQRSNIGYSVTGMISIESLKKLDLLKNAMLRCGLYRGKCMEINLEKEAMKWISWIDPKSASPDFHIPSSFGTLRLEG